MELSKRMNTIVEMIYKCDTIADIGTDHGYIPIYIIKNNIAKKVLACDINVKPLEGAKQNIINSNLSEFIETRLGSGLLPINKNEIDTAIISGMGGMLIIDILKNSSEIVKDIKQLVLQPQLDLYNVRKYIHSIGFKIDNEIMLIEEEKYYNVISAVKGFERYDNEFEYFFGKCLIEKKSIILKKYVENMLFKTEKTLKRINNNNSQSALYRKELLKKNYNMFVEVLKCL